MHSALYEGWVRHRRGGAKPHAFRQRLYMTYLDLAELDQAFAGRWLWGARAGAWVRFRRGDFFGDPRTPLDCAVRDRVQAETGVRPSGPIRMLTHLSHAGFNFNPVTFYYCFDAAGVNVEFVLAEITNTPWGERHAYVLRAGEQAGRIRHRFAKAFHVSPFLPMHLQYDWRFSTPGAALAVHMNVLQAERKVFDASLVLRRRAISTRALASTLVRFPLMPADVLAKIYWQALLLWLKGAAFHAHPRTQPLAAARGHKT